ILFDPRTPEQIAQAMISLAHDKALTARLVQAGAARAASFSDSRLMAEQYWEVFQQASKMKIHSDLLLGAHADGWAGPNVRLQIAPSEVPRTLDIEIALPSWVPISKVTMLIQQNRESKAEISVLRGQNGS